MPGISTNAGEIAERWRSRARGVEPAQRRAAAIIAPVMEREAQKILRLKVYSVPIPTGKDGKKKWRRSGNLIAREIWKANGIEVVGRNDSDHAAYRQSLGRGGRPIRSPGVQAVDWQGEAVQARRSWMLQIRAQEHRKALRGR